MHHQKNISSFQKAWKGGSNGWLYSTEPTPVFTFLSYTSLFCVCNISLFSICAPLPKCLCHSPSDNTCSAWDPACAGWLPLVCFAFPRSLFQPYCIFMFPVCSVNRGVKSRCVLLHLIHPLTDWEVITCEPVRDRGAMLPCQPVIISTSRPFFFSVAVSLALSRSNRMITGC